VLAGCQVQEVESVRVALSAGAVPVCGKDGIAHHVAAFGVSDVARQLNGGLGLGRGGQGDGEEEQRTRDAERTQGADELIGVLRTYLK